MLTVARGLEMALAVVVTEEYENGLGGFSCPTRAVRRGVSRVEARVNDTTRKKNKLAMISSGREIRSSASSAEIALVESEKWSTVGTK